MSPTPHTEDDGKLRVAQRWALAIAVCLFVSPALGVETKDRNIVLDAPADVAAGQKIYREGRLPSGEPVRAKAIGGVAISSAQATCMSCHRRSGLGSVEGNEVAPPIVGSILYDTGDPRTDVFKRNLGLMKPNGTASGLRPPYDDASLARVIRTGVGPGGRVLSPLMPRYELTDRQAAQLIAYLKTLSAKPSPGVTDTEIHFATVFAGPVTPERRAAALAILEAYFDDMNGLTRNEKARASHGTWYHEWREKSYRQWRLHVWDLKGPAATWRAQLDARYADQAVFAVIGGVGAGTWAPVHGFCEDNRLPCLLPVTDLPAIADGDFYNIYFTKGLTLEAQGLARHLAHTERFAEGGPIVQVYRPDDPRSATPATAFREALAAQGFNGLVEWRIDSEGTPSVEFWDDLAKRHSGASLVLWLAASDLHALGDSVALPPRIDAIYVSSALLDDSQHALPPAIQKRLFTTHRFLPPPQLKRMRRLQTWMRSRRIEASEPIVQASSFAAAQIVGNAVRHIQGFLLRDYLIEKIEHLVDSTLTDPPYPRLSLGPGQRFLSGRVYILGPPASGGDWTVVDDLLLR